jgi:hypothetical protein
MSPVAIDPRQKFMQDIWKGKFKAWLIVTIILIPLGGSVVTLAFQDGNPGPVTVGFFVLLGIVFCMGKTVKYYRLGRPQAPKPVKVAPVSSPIPIADLHTHTFTTFARMVWPPEYLIYTIALTIPKEHANEQLLQHIRLQITAAITQTVANFKLNVNHEKVFKAVQRSALNAANAFQKSVGYVDLKILAQDVSRNKPDIDPGTGQYVINE